LRVPIVVKFAEFANFPGRIMTFTTARPAGSPKGCRSRNQKPSATGRLPERGVGRAIKKPSATGRLPEGVSVAQSKTFRDRPAPRRGVGRAI